MLRCLCTRRSMKRKHCDTLSNNVLSIVYSIPFILFRGVLSTRARCVLAVHSQRNERTVQTHCQVCMLAHPLFVMQQLLQESCQAEG